MADATSTDAYRALERLASSGTIDPTAVSDAEILRTVLDSAGAVMRFGNPEGTDLEAETPIEDWALDALASALMGRSGRAQNLIDRYGHAPWDAEHDDYDEGARGGYRSHYRAALEDDAGASNG